MEQDNYFTPYDEAVQTKELQILKTLLPYTNNSIQPVLSIIIQVMQYRNSTNFTLSAADYKSPSEKISNILNDLKKYCSSTEREVIDTFLNLLLIMDNYESIIS